MNKEIILKIENESGLEKSKAQTLLSNFETFFEQAAKWEKEVKDIQITDISQTVEMKKARDGRLALKDIRVNAEKTKKKLKENILVEGRFIDGIYNVIVGITDPLEKELLEKEKFVERLEEKRIEELKKTRLDILSQYEVDASFIQVEKMDEPAFQNFVTSSKVAYDMKKEAEKKAENERIAKEKAEKEEQERIKIENEKLKKEAENQRKLIEKANEEKLKAEEKARKEREALEEKARIEREEMRRLEAERIAKIEAEKKVIEEKMRIEKEKREKEEKDRLQKIENEKKIEEEKIKSELMKPEKEKLLGYVEKLKMVEIPEIKNKELNDVLIKAKKMVNDIGIFIINNC